MSCGILKSNIMYSICKMRLPTRKTLKINVITNDWISICTQTNRDVKS